jgi:hypothetical protein
MKQFQLFDIALQAQVSVSYEQRSPGCSQAAASPGLVAGQSAALKHSNALSVQVHVSSDCAPGAPPMTRSPPV